MIILTIRTDNETAQIGVYNDETQLAHHSWHAHRELAETLHTKIVDVLMEADVRLHQLEAIVAFEGPGSFTGLRIGVSVANALAYALDIPIVGSTNETWLKDGLRIVMAGKNHYPLVPQYGAEPNITKPKH